MQILLLAIILNLSCIRLNYEKALKMMKILDFQKFAAIAMPLKYLSNF